MRGAVALDDVYTAGRLVDAIAAYLPEWPVGDAAELARASAAAYSSAYGALSASQSARDLVAAELTDDVRVCAQVDAVDIVALAEPLDGRARAHHRDCLGVVPAAPVRAGRLVVASSSCSFGFSKRRHITRPMTATLTTAITPPTPSSFSIACSECPKK